MKYLFALSLLALSANASALENLRGKQWQCMAKSTYSVKATTVVWGNYSASRAEAEDSAHRKCVRAATAPGNCRVTSCWIQTGLVAW